MERAIYNWLDENGIPPDLDWTQTASETIQALKDKEYDAIFLDHDLGGKVMVKSGIGTGYEVAEWIAENLEEVPQVILHSMNPVGVENMKSVLPTADVVPFHILLQNLRSS